MHASQLFWSDAAGWSGALEPSKPAGLVFYFGARQTLAQGKLYPSLRELYPHAHLVGCSTGGQLAGSEVSDDTACALALDFAGTDLRVAKARIAGATASREVGATIGAALKGERLAGVFVLSDGLHVNGSALVEGIASEVGGSVPVSGGLAGDGPDFIETLVGCDGPPEPDTVAAVGFYGDAIRIGHGSAGGWDVFGPLRRITRSDGNVLYEVDGKPALDLYKLYLGPEESRNLPGSALLFPLRIFDPRHPDRSVVRTILAVDHEQGSMTFAGDMPVGWSAQLMRGNIGRLCDGAAEATHRAVQEADAEPGSQSAAIFVSCIGRRLLMGQRTDEEIEAARAELGETCLPTGFYSYGEISPHEVSGFCQLHNQTMTVTVFAERAV
jgi:hypothetical protein